MYERVRKKPSKEKKIRNERIKELMRLNLLLKEIKCNNTLRLVYERRGDR